MRVDPTWFWIAVVHFVIASAVAVAGGAPYTIIPGLAFLGLSVVFAPEEKKTRSSARSYR